MLIATVVISFFLRFFLVNDPPEVVYEAALIISVYELGLDLMRCISVDLLAIT